MAQFRYAGRVPRRQRGADGIQRHARGSLDRCFGQRIERQLMCEFGKTLCGVHDFLQTRYGN
jgi:hypothetical protein